MTQNTEPGAITLSERSRAIIAAATLADGTPPFSDQVSLSLAQGRRLVIENDHAVGVIGEGELDLVVDPASRGQGFGRALLEELVSDYSDSRLRPLRAWVHGVQPAAVSLLTRNHFAPARELLRLTLAPHKLAAAIAHSRPLPEGFTAQNFDLASPHQADEWVRVNAAAFVDHPEQGTVTRADFDALVSERWFLESDLRLAYHQNATTGSPELAGFAWVKTTPSSDVSDQTDEIETELYVLGVAPKFAGVGLGAALLGESFVSMANHSPDRITLYVDGENSSALNLYLRAGFEIEQRSIQYVRQPIS